MDSEADEDGRQGDQPSVDDDEAARRRRLAALSELARSGGGDQDDAHSTPTARKVTPSPAQAPRILSHLLRSRLPRPLVTLSVLLLVVSVGAVALPFLHDRLFSQPPGPAPFQTASIPAGADLFYFDVEVPWASVTLDGQPIHVPRIGADAPLQLAGGRHVLAWIADPFQKQACTLSVPHSTGDTCHLASQPQPGSSGLPGVPLVYLGESLATLPAASQQSLIQAIQDALSGFSASVQPGERYFTQDRGIQQAAGPLRATLTLQVDARAVGTEVDDCQLDPRNGAQRCEVADRDCTRLCTVPWPARQPATPAAWDVLAIVRPSWGYVSAQGELIAGDQPISAGGAGSAEQLVRLLIRWENGGWHVEPLLGARAGPALAARDQSIFTDPACAAARGDFLQPSAAGSMRFISGPNPAAGCLIVVATSADDLAATPTPASVALYLERFGVLLAVNDAAHRASPQTPEADSNELAVARQLTSLPGQSSTISGSTNG